MRRLPMILLAALAGCESMATLPVTGVFDTRADKFLGTVSADLATGAGKITVNTQQGAACNGVYKRTDATQGIGTLTCSDGRSGEFRFLARGLEGEGFGKMTNGDTFSFSFGQGMNEQRAREGAALARGLQSLGEGISPPARTTTECFTGSGMVSCTTR